MNRRDAAISDVGLDRILALLVVAITGTGLLTLRAGAPGAAWVFVLHGLLGGALLLAVVLKLRRSVPRAVAAGRWRRLVAALAVGLVVLGALAGGFAWVARGQLVQVGPWTLLTLHAVLGLVILPLVVLHLLPRRWRLLRPRRGAGGSAGAVLTRRSMLAAALFSVASVGAWGAAAALERVAGGQRRFTGSRWLPAGGIPPVTTFFGEPTPAVDLAAWRLVVRGRVATPREYALRELSAVGEMRISAVLDCTGGWAMETSWTGVPMAALLDAAGPDARSTRVVVRSVTGWGAALGMDEARRTLLATRVAGAPLPVDNGAPCRLVAPERRGLDWVKWVSEVEVL